MHFSISSLLISLLLASLLVLILQLLISKQFSHKIFRIDFLVVFALIITIRLILPIEFIETRTFSSHWFLPHLYRLGRLPTHLLNFSVGEILIIIWLIGTLVELTLELRSIFHLNRFVSSLPALSDNISLNKDADIIPAAIKISMLRNNTSPFVCGLVHPHIVLPFTEFPQDDQVHILRHEMQHITNRDIITKYVLTLLVCLYWWFPPIYVFRRQVNTILEMRVDQQVVRGLPKSQYFSYIKSLVNVSKKLQVSDSKPLALSENSLSNFTMFEQNTLRQRIDFLLSGYTIKKTKGIAQFILVLVPLLITSVIIEPDSHKPGDLNGTVSVDKSSSYIIHKNGTYTLYLSGKRLGSFKHLDSLKDPEIKKLKVIER